MFEAMILLALLGSALAGLWDLKTTEVPDEIPAAMAAVGILYWLASGVSTGDYYPLAASVVFSLGLGITGYVLYKTGKWGGADGFMLAAIAAMIPIYSGKLFMPDYLMNFLVVSAVYMIVYSAVLGITNPSVFGHLGKDLKKSWPYVVLLPAAFMGLLFIMKIPNIPAYGAGTAFLLVFWRYAVVLEKKVFRKKIPASGLRPGDVLEKMIWRGLTKQEVIKLKKKGGHVVIKEGVRFVPVFAITLAVTLLYGNVLLLILSA